MTADDLVKRVIEYGADESGIQDRFYGDAELYKSCFDEFIEEANFDLLDKAINARDFEQAFSAAHALKGLAGNLGVTAFYDAIRKLVESLRQRDDAKADAQYKEVCRQRERLIAVANGIEPAAEQRETEDAAQETTDAAKSTLAEKRTLKAWFQKADKKLMIALAALIVSVLVVVLVFAQMLNNYRVNTEMESANHLIEINHQVKLYVESKMTADWRTAYSLSDTIADGDFISDDDAIFRMLRRKKDIWDVTDIRIYTESGYSISSEGVVEHNSIASKCP